MINRIVILTMLLSLSSTSNAAYQRIVSLDLCMDWMIAHYVPKQRVAALSPMHKRYPIDWIANDWPTHSGDLESVYGLKADVILVGEFAAWQLRQRLHYLQEPVEVFALPKTVAEVVQYERQFFRTMELPRALASPIPRPFAKPEKKQTLLLLGSNGIGTGRNTLEHDLITYAGWDNYLTEDGYISLDLEKIVQNPPDAIVWAAPEHNALANQFSEHAALKFAVPEQRWLQTDYWRWQCPGPWMWDLIGQLHQWLE